MQYEYTIIGLVIWNIILTASLILHASGHDQYVTKFWLDMRLFEQMGSTRTEPLWAQTLQVRVENLVGWLRTVEDRVRKQGNELHAQGKATKDLDYEVKYLWQGVGDTNEKLNGLIDGQPKNRFKRLVSGWLEKL